MADRLIELLAQGKDYYWALRQAHEGSGSLRDHGIDDDTLAALRALEPGVARFPRATAKQADHEYFPLVIPPSINVFFAPLLTEYEIESGTELFPEKLTWTFAHDEIQYCTGGDTLMEARFPHGGYDSKHLRVGDVMLIPENTELTYHSSEEGDRFGHAHIFLMNLSRKPRSYYDIVPTLRLRAHGMAGGQPQIAPVGLDGPGGIGHRIEVTDWAQLVEPRPNGARTLPSWLRNGWANRELTRALDYSEGTKALVIAGPDRTPDDYLEWESGGTRCRVNPLIAEPNGAITDCVFPDGWRGSSCHTELWTVLRGSMTVSQTLAPLHAEAAEAHVTANSQIIVPGGARVQLGDVSSDLVVRRLAGTCAHNGHWAMMERKLEADGLAS